MRWLIPTTLVWAAVCATIAAQQVPLGLDLHVPTPVENPTTADKIAIGRGLFFDRRLSRDGSISCATCHDPARAFTDGRAIAVGIEGRVGRRHSPSVVNLAYATRFFWDGRVTSLEEQVLMPIEDPNEMDLPVMTAATRVGLSRIELAHALASFVRSILVGNSRFDRFVAGDRAALEPREQAGLEVFRGKGNCTSCHVGPTLSDDRLHNTGIAWRDRRLIDEGGGAGRFKTPTLREITRTAPYMHDGSIATLDEVIDYYNRGGNRHPMLDAEIRPLQLSDQEKADLRAFLTALSSATPTR